MRHTTSGSGTDTTRTWPPTRYPERRRLAGPLGAGVIHFDRLLRVVWQHPLLYGALVLAALYSSWWGYTDFYGAQFDRVPLHTWPFIADSPNAVLLWLVASLVIKTDLDAIGPRAGRALTFLVHVAIVWNVKVGLWTDFVLLFHHDHFFAGTGAQDTLQWVLIASHLGMVGYALLLFRKAYPLGTAGYLGVLALALLFDFVDYGYAHFFLGDRYILWPNGVPARDVHVVALITVFLSVATTTLLATGMRLRGPPQGRRA